MPVSRSHHCRELGARAIKRTLIVSVADITLPSVGQACDNRRPAVPLPPKASAVSTTPALQVAQTDGRLAVGSEEDIT